MTELRLGFSAARALIALLLISTPTLAFSRPASAADNGESGDVRPEIIVSGALTTEYESSVDATGFTTVIRAGEAWRGYRTVGELLGRSAGLQVTNFGGPEDLSTVSVRGSGPAQVRVLLDGVALTRAGNAVVNLADIPLDAVDRIEIHRGYTPVRFASSGASSVINIITRQIEEPTLSASASFGSFTTVKGTVSGGSPLAGGTLSGVLTVRHTDGDFEYIDDRGTPLNPDDDVETRRKNNDSSSVDALARYVVPLGDSRLTVTNDVFYKDRGTPGNGVSQALDARAYGLRNIFAADWTSEDDRYGAAFDFSYLDEVVEDPSSADTQEGNSSLGLPYDKAHNTTSALTLRGRAARPLPFGQYLETSIAGGFERFLGRYPQNPFSGNDESRFNLAVAVGDDIYIDRWNFTATLQVRHESLWNRFDSTFAGIPVPTDERPDNYDGATNPRLGLRWDPVPALTLKGNLGTWFRPPTFRELFGTDGFTAPNPTLEPESGLNRDIGFIARAARLGPIRSPVLEAVYFDNDLDDLILLVTTGGNIPVATNFSRARIRGLELRAAFELGPFLSVEGNYTHQDGENRSRLVELRGRELPNLPSDVAFARLVFSQPDFSVAYEFDYQSDVFLDDTENRERRQPGYGIHNLELLFALGDGGFLFKFQAMNLTDEQYFDRWQFPQPGRAFYATLSYEHSDGVGGAGNAT